MWACVRGNRRHLPAIATATPTAAPMTAPLAPPLLPVLLPPLLSGAGLAGLLVVLPRVGGTGLGDGEGEGEGEAGALTILPGVGSEGLGNCWVEGGGGLGLQARAGSREQLWPQAPVSNALLHWCRLVNPPAFCSQQLAWAASQHQDRSGSTREWAAGRQGQCGVESQWDPATGRQHAGAGYTTAEQQLKNAAAAAAAAASRQRSRSGAKVSAHLWPGGQDDRAYRAEQNDAGLSGQRVPIHHHEPASGSPHGCESACSAAAAHAHC